MRRGLYCLWLIATSHGDALTFRPDMTSSHAGLSTCCTFSVSARTESFVNLSQPSEWRGDSPHGRTEKNRSLERTGKSTVINQFEWCKLWSAPLCLQKHVTECMLCMCQTTSESNATARGSRAERRLTSVSILEFRKSMTSTTGGREAHKLCCMDNCRSARSRGHAIADRLSLMEGEEQRSHDRPTFRKQSITAAEERMAREGTDQTKKGLRWETVDMSAGERQLASQIAEACSRSEDIIAPEGSLDELRLDKSSGSETGPEQYGNKTEPKGPDEARNNTMSTVYQMPSQRQDVLRQNSEQNEEPQRARHELTKFVLRDEQVGRKGAAHSGWDKEHITVVPGGDDRQRDTKRRARNFKGPANRRAMNTVTSGRRVSPMDYTPVVPVDRPPTAAPIERIHGEVPVWAERAYTARPETMPREQAPREQAPL